MSNKSLYTIKAYAPFFPPGLTVSIRCPGSAVGKWVVDLASLASMLTTSNQNNPVEAEQPEINQVEEIPEGIQRYAASWGEDWATASILERAKQLFSKHGNWEMVYQDLLKQDGEES